MEIIHLSNSDSGGAGSAAYHFHRQLKNAGYDSKLLVATKKRDDDAIVKAPKKPKPLRKWLKFKNKWVERLTSKGFQFYGLSDRKSKMTQNWLREHITDNTHAIVVHWVAQFVTIDDILAVINGKKIRIFITLMDMAPFTGGCHYSFGCTSYFTGCQSCPASKHLLIKNAVRNNSMLKALQVKELAASAICINRFIGEQAKASNIPFSEYLYVKPPVSPSIFKYSERYRLADNPKILISAYDKKDARKGYSFLLLALQELSKLLLKANLSVTILVPTHSLNDMPRYEGIEFDGFEFATTAKELANVYHRADIFVNTSSDDSGPLMITEALFCGVPIVSTRVGVAQELIDFDDQLGRLCDYGDTIALATTLFRSLFDLNDKLAPSKYIEQKAKQYYQSFADIDNLFSKLKI